MDGFQSADTVRRAVLTLYAQADGHAQANDFLVAFAESDQAWQTALQVIGEVQAAAQQGQIDPGQVDQVAYFAANLLYNKVCKHWKRLPVELRPTLGNTLLQILRAAAQQQLQLGPVVVKTLCLSVVAVALRTPNGPSAQAGEALAIGAAGTAPAVDVALQMLRQMPEEVDKVDISRQRRNEICAEMRGLLPSVLQFCGQVLAGGGPGGLAETHSTAALETISEWVKMTGLSLSAFAMGSAESRASFEKMLQLLTGHDAAVAVAAAKALEAALIRHEEPSEGRTMAVNVLRDALLATRPLLEATAESFMAGGDVDQAQTTTHALACLFVVFASRQLPQLIGVDSATPANVEFMELFMRLSGHPYRRIALLTQDVWLEVSDVSLAKRAPAFREPVHAQLLEVLLQQCTYPEDYEGDWDDIDSPGVDESVFKELRGDVPGVSGTGDALINCFTVLKHNFLMALVPRLQHRGVGGQLSWNTAESALYALQAVSGASDIGGGISVELAAPRQLPKGNGISDNLLRQQQIRELLLGILEYITQSGDAALRSHPLLLNAGAGVIGAYASLLRLEAVPLHSLGYENTSREVQEAAATAAAAAAAASGSTEAKIAPALLTPALEYIGAALAVPMATKAACRAFRLICVDQAASAQVGMLVAQTGGEAFAAFLAASVGAGGAQEDREKIVEGATRVIGQLVSDARIRQSISSAGKDPIAVAGEAAVRFSSPLLLDTLSKAAVASAGGAEAPRSESVVEALGLMATMVKFLDMPSATVASSSGAGSAEETTGIGHIAMPLISALLPLLEALTRSPMYADDDRVAGGIFVVFGEAFKNLPTIMHQHLSPLVQTIVQAFERHRWPAALDCVKDSVDAFGSMPGSEAAFRNLLQHLTQCTVALLQSPGHSPTEEPAIVQSYFNMLKGYIIFCPLALVQGSNETVAVLFGAAVACVEVVKERDSLRAVLLFIVAFLKLKAKTGDPQILEAYHRVIHPIIASEQGQRLLRGLLSALAGGAAANVHEPIAECATTLLTALTLNAGSPVQGWVVSILGENEKCRELDEAYRHRLLNAIMTFGSGLYVTPSRPGAWPRNPKLRMIMLDFAKVCTGEQSIDDCHYDLSG